MQRLGRQLGALALLAMLVRALIPAGYMIAEAGTASGRYLVVKMCDGHSGAVQVVDLDTGKILDPSDTPKKSDGNNNGSPCVFAAAPPLSAPPAIVEPIVFQFSHLANFAVVRDIRPGRGIAAPPPPSTGPPSQI